MGRRHLSGEKIRQYAALPCVVRGGELLVLLVTSRETRRWIIPKGWPEKRLKPHEVAAREAYEEAGVVGRIGKKPLASFHYIKRITDAKRLPCLVEVFPLAVLRELNDWPEKAQRQRRWMTPGEAALHVSEAGLIELLLTLSGWERT